MAQALLYLQQGFPTDQLVVSGFVRSSLNVVTLLRAYATGQRLPPAPMGPNEKAGVALLVSSKSSPSSGRIWSSTGSAVVAGLNLLLAPTHQL